MNLEEAINTAVDFEQKVLQTYRQAESQATDPVGRKVFGILAREEQGHVDYLSHCLQEWRATGRLATATLATAIPSRGRIAEGMERMAASMKGKPSAASARELALLRQALSAEEETSAFYLRMVSELPAGSRELFARFLEIEQGHVAIVQAEIDAVSGLGFWFDVPEFRLEAG